MEKQKFSWICWVVVFLFGGIALAQVTTGTISGTVGDSTGAVIPGAQVTLKNVDTGISRALTSDEQGRYSAPQLPLGTYEVTAEASGFQMVVRSGITLTVGRVAVVNFSLQVGAVAERITVTGEAPLIETTTSSVSGLVNQAQMRDLPLNARSYEQLAFLQPNVYRQYNSTSNITTGYSPKISAAGMRQGYNAYIVDGINIADNTGQTPGSAAGQLMGVETLREFRVLTNNYPAQYGNATGAIIEAASRSGTNSFHGSLFEFLRNDKMDARNFFDSQKPPFRRNQFGGVIGGRIVRDRLFFFGSYEGLRQRLTTTNNVLVPTADARNGILPDPTDPSKTITIPVHPNVVPLLRLYPVPQVNLGGGIGRYSFLFRNKQRVDFASGRIDYQRSEKVSYFVRYQVDSSDITQPKSGIAIDPWGYGLESLNQTLTLAETRLFTGALINEFRAGLVRYTPRDRLVLTGPDVQIRFPGTVGAGNIAFSTGFGAGNVSIASLGVPGFPFVKFYRNTFQFSDNLSYVQGAHSMKMGLDVQLFQDNGYERTMEGFYRDSGTGGGGTAGALFNFDSLENLLRGRPFQFIGPTASFPAGISGRASLFALYFQDDFRLLPTLTLNMGVRYEFITPYADLNSNFIVLNDLWGTPKIRQKEAYSGSVCSRCVDPRFGFAWDMFSNGTSVLKGGFGIFHVQLLGDKGFIQIPNEGQGGISLTAQNPNFPDPTVPIPGATLNYSISGTGNVGVTVIPKIPSTPTAMHWNLTLDQRLSPTTTLRLAYLGSRGSHLEGGYPLNTNTYEDHPDGTRFFAPGTHRIRPDFAPIDTVAYDFNSFYNAFSVTVGRRFSNGIGFEASYAFGRSTDDTSFGLNWRGQLSSEIRVVDGRRNTYHGLSAFDMRHRFVSNFTYEIPSLARSNAGVNKFLSGWQMNGIITFQAGTPFTPWIGFDRANTTARQAGEQQRPDLNPAFTGSKLCPCTPPSSLGGGVQEAPQRYYNPTAYTLPERGTYGNLGRNTLIGPGLANFDFALVKNSSLTERLNLVFRFEMFNLFNRVNWAMPSSRLFETNGSFTGSAGVITATSTASRQLQFALKLVF